MIKQFIQKSSLTPNEVVEVRRMIIKSEFPSFDKEYTKTADDT